MRGRRRPNTQRSKRKAEEVGIVREKLERESTTTQTQQGLPQRTPSNSSTASRKRKSESIEPSTSSLPLAKRRQTKGSVATMAPEFLPSTSEGDGSQIIMEDDALSVFSTEGSDEHRASFSESECGDEEHSYDEFNEELENDAFRELEAGLNDYRYLDKETPPQLTALRCTGIGSPKKVWSLLCRKNELIRASHHLLDNHPELAPRTRAVLVDWMMEVCGSEKQHRETFHLAVDYVDRFLGTFHGIRSQTFQLVGTAALFLASKYEEIYPPKLEEFVAYTDGACSEHDVRTFEIIMLKELHWSLSPLTSVHWLSMYMQFLGNKEVVKNDGEKHVVDQPFIVPDTLREDFINMAKVLDLVLLDVASLKYSYRELAAAVLFACYEPHSLVQEVTGYSYADLLKVVEWVEPVIKVCERLRSLGDPILIVEGVRADDLHNIQTHPDQDFDEIMADIEKEREIAERARQKFPIARRRGPLRTRCSNPDQITIFT